MDIKRDARRRWLGGIFLCISAAMLLAGEMFLSERLRQSPLLTVIYWMLCFVFVALAILIALVDLIIVRRRSVSEHRILVEKTLGKIAHEKQTHLSSKNGKENSL
jgi:drug/metabolite transporter (DMT)-like permease